MKRILLFLMVISASGLVGCTTASHTTQAKRSTAGIVDLTNRTVAERLEDTLGLIEQIKAEMPEKGSPYYLVLSHFNRYYRMGVKKILKEHAGQPYMNVPDWLPNASDIQESQLAAYKKLVLQVSELVAHYKVMQISIYYLDLSIIVEKYSPELGLQLHGLSEIMESYNSFLRPRTFLVSQAQQDELRLMAFSKAARSLANGIEKYYPDMIHNPQTRAVVAKVVRGVQSLPKTKGAEKQKTRIQKMIGAPDWKVTSDALTHINLTGSGEIDGAQEDFNRVMTVQMGFELISDIYANAVN